jgi:hypothetical protein
VETAGTKPRLRDLFVQRGLITQEQLEAMLARRNAA